VASARRVDQQDLDAVAEPAVTGSRPLTLKSLFVQVVFLAAIGGTGVSEARAATAVWIATLAAIAIGSAAAAADERRAGFRIAPS